MFAKYLGVSWEPNPSIPENLAKVSLYWQQTLAWQVVIVSMLEIASAAATVEGKAANVVQPPQTCGVTGAMNSTISPIAQQYTTSDCGYPANIFSWLKWWNLVQYKHIKVLQWIPWAWEMCLLSLTRLVNALSTSWSLVEIVPVEE